MLTYRVLVTFLASLLMIQIYERNTLLEKFLSIIYINVYMFIHAAQY